MPVNLILGDIFTVPTTILVNPVNCVGVMGAGLAKQVKSRYPQMFSAYQEVCQRGNLYVGTLHTWQSDSGLLIVNLPTKDDWRQPSSYELIQKSLQVLANYLATAVPVTASVALPALGTGNGGLAWAGVWALIMAELDHLPHQIYVVVNSLYMTDTADTDYAEPVKPITPAKTAPQQFPSTGTPTWTMPKNLKVRCGSNVLYIDAGYTYEENVERLLAIMRLLYTRPFLTLQEAEEYVKAEGGTLIVDRYSY
jgi:O-acetyl-ADP-ribose deacetylase (regulator of RNase III)